MTDSTDSHIDLGAAAEFEELCPTLAKRGDRRFVVIREGERVRVLDDRCPHEGYPLSQGALRDGVLTCRWHNWKFDASSGECLFGGEPVRSFPVTIEGDRVFVDATIDSRAERRRLAASLRAGQANGASGSVLRDALRLEAIDGDLMGALGVVVDDEARREPWGFEHGLAMTADVASWIDEARVEPRAAFAALGALVAESILYAPEREAAPPARGEPNTLADALREEDRRGAEGIARGLARAGRFEELVARGVLAYAADDLLGYGHAVIFAAKAIELAARWPESAEALAATLAVGVGWSTAESSLPGWNATHDGIRAATPKGRSALSEDGEAALVEATLEAERPAVAATLAHLEAGADPRGLLRASARAAAERLRRYDRAWSDRLDAPVTPLDVSHALTFTESCLALADHPLIAEETVARFAVQAAGFVGKLRRADAPKTRPLAAATGSGDLSALARALERRDVGAAVAAAVGLELDAYLRVAAPFALHDAVVRPVFVAHTVKTVEAAARLERRDPEAGALYRASALSLVAPRLKERNGVRAARIASEFLATLRPPPGLY